MFQLRSTFSLQALHIGSWEECNMCRNAMTTYGVRSDKIEIVPYFEPGKELQ